MRPRSAKMQEEVPEKACAAKTGREGGGQGQWEEDQQGGGKKPRERVDKELKSGEIQGK